MPASRLGPYREKRDFSKTVEPAGGGPGSGNRFVVHKHSATADHYDLRLEHDGVLKSWAVPKGPSLDPDDKRLAVETEDHPVEYIDFEGIIPEGSYGAGPMIVWDTGVWAPMDDVDRALSSGAFKFRLAGEKLNGGFMLTRLKPKPGEAKRNWLLFKERDPAARKGSDILAERPESAKSGLRIEELAEAGPARRPPKPARGGAPRPGRIAGAVRADMPARLAPQLASSASDPPQGDGWLHEIKFDGYRTIAFVSGDGVRMTTRSGLDWTARYADLAERFRALPCREAIIDGEVVVLDDKGVSHFSALQEALSDKASSRLVYFAFDLLHLDGYDLRNVPLERRKKALARLLADGSAGPAVQYSDHFAAGEGRALFDHASELGLEGVVSKRADAPYREGRSSAWIKAKAPLAGDFVIGGYTVSKAAGGLAALALGEWAADGLRYVGKVGTGFDAGTLASLLDRLEPLRAGAPLFDGAPKDVLPVRPVLSASIRYTSRTSAGALRHAVFQGLREAGIRSSTGKAERKRLISDADLASVWVTNPTRRLFGRSGPTKLDVAVYYAAVGDFMLPHILGRAVSLVRCPTGKPQDCFFQRHAFAGMPPSVATIETANSDGETRRYIAIEDARAYLALAQFGVVEFHAWGSTAKRIDKPDRIVFDLDPGEGIGWREIVEAAMHLRGELEALGLVPFVKTSGGKGLHVVVPVVPKLGWKEIHERTGAIAAAVASAEPSVFTTVMGQANRKRRIFIDFHRNARSATAVAPYSLRARVNLPASAPLGWPDLESVDAPDDLNYSTLPGLLTLSGDPWADMSKYQRPLKGAGDSG